ncbi:tyrosine-protein phosphatase [Arthrobacter caoxuetaonis]|uniref:Tyrosine-protein phosphatase n=1 Tax=Arthrobacter caoxuetaonis TaxID=2886935 RepID=A0A9X1MG90_9MICC|nr:tyrosine-protein phosphatase [Arthrobacter caoxuetaonis]MCC3299071.1 tyrosine-protein phosphatase [Arthrobacter caoxuetaonis]USQ58594.1 tyrosine-protein phosphatase [Arthrobacter caoxuetaonis]
MNTELPSSPQVPADVPPSVGGLFNFRDAASGTGTPGLRRGLLFRSGALNDLDAAGLAELGAARIATVVDLREPVEVASAPDTVPAGTRVVNIPLYCGSVPVSEPIEAVYRHLLQNCARALTSAVGEVIRNLDGGVLVHCAAGKDRTGLVVALVLDAAGASRSAIVEDYSRTEAALPCSFRRAVLARLGGRITDPAEMATAVRLHLASPQEVLDSALQVLAEESFEGETGAAAYLLRNGLDRGMLVRARVLLHGIGTPAA